MRLLLVVGLAVVLVPVLVPVLACDNKADPAAAAIVSKDAIPITVDGDGFKPTAVKFKKGAPATLVFTRTTDDTCATEVVFPQLDIKKELPKNKPIAITIPTDKEQTLTFQCGMGMYKSTVVIAMN